MAFIFYKQSTAEERLLCLCYPYRPLLEDYLSPKNPDVLFTTSFHCYKLLSRKSFAWDDLMDDLCSDVEIQSGNQEYLKSVADYQMTVLYDFDCNNMRIVFNILIMYYFAKVGLDYQISHKIHKMFEKHSVDCAKHVQAIYRCQTLHNAYIFTSIHLADGKFLQVLLRYGLQCLASSDEYEIARTTAEKFA